MVKHPKLMRYGSGRIAYPAFAIAACAADSRHPSTTDPLRVRLEEREERTRLLFAGQSSPDNMPQADNLDPATYYQGTVIEPPLPEPDLGEVPDVLPVEPLLP
ncbi:MAG: hypothetical protein JHC52_07885 [Chthoniobacterales bacterium]|nr:hypothetical protein [Chthoniobacterales bacterium]